MCPDPAAGAVSTEDQGETVAFLSRGASYGRAELAVERVDTHCSSVFLVGDRAYKLKHALAFASLDYRGVARREAACRAELALNRRTAPDLYLRVRSINRAPGGGLGFDAPGPAIDWVVVMRRFRQEDLFDRMAEAGRLDLPLMRALGGEIARFHARAGIVRTEGGAVGIRRAILHNLEELLLRGDLRDGEVARALHDRSLVRLDAAAALLDARREHGMVRRCHGDLRLANICLFQGRPTLFDAIEFSDEIGCIDTMYDLAFLLMDLRQRGLADLAAAVLGRYLALTGDREGLALLPLFLSVRAATRSYAVAESVRRHEPAAAARRIADAQSLLAFAGAVLDESADAALAGGAAPGH